MKLKKLHCVLEFNQFQWLKQYVKFNTQKSIEAEKHGDKDGKALYKLMNNAVYRKTMQMLKNRIDVKLASNKKKLFQMHAQSKLYVTQNIWQ